MWSAKFWKVQKYARWKNIQGVKLSKVLNYARYFIMQGAKSEKEVLAMMAMPS